MKICGILLILSSFATCQVASTYYEFGADLILKKDLNSESSRPGDKIEASLQRNIWIGGKQLPKGTKVYGTVLYVDHFRPQKSHKKEIVVPLQQGKVGFELAQVVLPNGTEETLLFHLRGMQWQGPMWEMNKVALSTPDYEGRKVNQLSANEAFRIPAGAELLILEEDRLRPALYRLGSVEVLDSIPGLDPVSYLASFTGQINSVWKEMASSIRAPFVKGTTTVEFEVAKNGEIRHIRLVRSTNSRDQDLAGIKSLLKFQRLPELPGFIPNASLPLRMSFIYDMNFVPPENSLGPAVPVLLDPNVRDPGPLSDSIVISVMVDHDGMVKDATFVTEKSGASDDVLKLVRAMHFSTFSQGVGFPLRHSIAVLPRVTGVIGDSVKHPTETVTMVKEEPRPVMQSPSNNASWSGVPGSQTGGIISSTSVSVPRSAIPQRVRVSMNVSEGLLIKKVQPTYPQLARQARVQGKILLQAEIDKEGSIESLQLISGHPILAPAAIEAVKQWLYKPYTLNGEAVAVETQVEVDFFLSTDGMAAGGTSTEQQNKPKDAQKQ